MDKVIVQAKDFDLTTEVNLARLITPQIGAIVSFVGTVRDLQSETLRSYDT